MEATTSLTGRLIAHTGMISAQHERVYNGAQCTRDQSVKRYRFIPDILDLLWTKWHQPNPVAHSQ